jgi:acetyltransferase-like isoleucine patch superfamily enzyme
MNGVDANEPSIVTVGNNISLMTGVDVNVLSVATVGNNVSLMPGVYANELSIVHLHQASMIHYYLQ